MLRKVREHNELQYAISNVNAEKAYALPSCKLASDDSGNSQNAHCDEHERKVEDERCVVAKEGRLSGNVEGIDGNCRARNENEVEDICTDDVTERERAVTLHKRGDSGYKLGKAGAESNDCKRDNCLRNAEHLRDNDREGLRRPQ